MMGIGNRSKLGLPTSVYYALRAFRGDLDLDNEEDWPKFAAIHDAQLLRIPNFGKVSLVAFNDWCAEKGLKRPVPRFKADPNLPTIFMAAEFGFRACERGDNLQMMQKNLRELFED